MHADEFLVFSRFLHQFSEVSGHASRPLTPVERSGLEQLARGLLSDSERERWATVMCENFEALEFFAQQMRTEHQTARVEN